MNLPGLFPTDYTTLAANLDKNSKMIKLVLNNETNNFYLVDDEGEATEITTSGSAASFIESSFDALIDTNYRPNDFDNYLYITNNDGISNSLKGTISIVDAGDGNQISLFAPYNIRLETALSGDTSSIDMSVDSIIMNSVGAISINSEVINMANIPTSDPSVAGQLWSNLGILTVSAG